MRKSAAFLLASMVMVLLPGFAHAQVTIGERLNSIGSEIWKPLFLLISFGSFILGLVLLGLGLMRLTRQNESRGGIWDSGLAHIVAAALLLSLPDAAGVGVASFFGNTSAADGLGAVGLDVNNGTGTVSVDSLVSKLREAGPTQNCLAVDAPAACMAENLAVNAIPMAIWTLFAFAFLLGLIGLASAIMDITKGQQQGGFPKGWATKFFTSVLLLNGMTLYTFTTNTLLGARSGSNATIDEYGLVKGSSMLSYNVASGPDILKKYGELIGHCFTILAFFGAWAFLRGIFMLRSAAEGRSQGTVGMGLVYIVAGILLANSKYSACMILTTLGGQEMGAGFCSGVF